MHFAAWEGTYPERPSNREPARGYSAGARASGTWAVLMGGSLRIPKAAIHQNSHRKGIVAGIELEISNNS
jgi:hypothetical protein